MRLYSVLGILAAIMLVLCFAMAMPVLAASARDGSPALQSQDASFAPIVASTSMLSPPINDVKNEAVLLSLSDATTPQTVSFMSTSVNPVASEATISPSNSAVTTIGPMDLLNSFTTVCIVAVVALLVACSAALWLLLRGSGWHRLSKFIKHAGLQHQKYDGVSRTAISSAMNRRPRLYPSHSLG